MSNMYKSIKTQEVTKIHFNFGRIKFVFCQAREHLAQVDKDKVDLLHLHSIYKLTWIPDKVIQYIDVPLPEGSSSSQHMFVVQAQLKIQKKK